MQRRNLLGTHPDLAKEWHPTKNGDLTPKDFTLGSKKKIWWKCPKGKDHVWGATIGSRISGSGCPYCAGQKVSAGNNLSVLYPDLAKEWHPTKNGKLTPKDFTPGSGKKVWWQCPNADDHEYLAIIRYRTGGSGCPYCSGKKNK